MTRASSSSPGLAPTRCFVPLYRLESRRIEGMEDRQHSRSGVCNRVKRGLHHHGNRVRFPMMITYRSRANDQIPGATITEHVDTLSPTPRMNEYSLAKHSSSERGRPWLVDPERHVSGFSARSFHVAACCVDWVASPRQSSLDALRRQPLPLPPRPGPASRSPVCRACAMTTVADVA